MVQEVRIIPARAGSTFISIILVLTASDHPRSRGVYSRDLVVRDAEPGSSPLARGLLSPCESIFDGERIIPARAGSTSMVDKGSISTRDHPRSRGVYFSPGESSTPFVGSSPLARGLRDVCRCRGVVLGIIPARAGSTVS